MKVGAYGTKAVVNVTFRVPEALRDQLLEAARTAGVTKSQWLREAIERRLRDQAPDQP